MCAPNVVRGSGRPKKHLEQMIFQLERDSYRRAVSSVGRPVKVVENCTSAKWQAAMAPGTPLQYHPSESHLLDQGPVSRPGAVVASTGRRRVSTRKTWTWRSGVPPSPDQAQSSREVCKTTFAGHGCGASKDDRKRKAAVLIPAPSQRWPQPPPQQARAIRRGRRSPRRFWKGALRPRDYRRVRDPPGGG